MLLNRIDGDYTGVRGTPIEINDYRNIVCNAPSAPVCLMNSLSSPIRG